MQRLSLIVVNKIWLLAAILAGFIITASASADTIVRSFGAKTDIETGSVVALVADDKSSVEPAPVDDPTRIYGVVVEKEAAPVTVEQTGDQIFVSNGGIYPVLVNTDSGPINPGDYLSMSFTEGVAAKATKRHAYVLGRATQSYNNAGTGKIIAQITPGKNPRLREDTAVPGPLRKLGESIAGKPLSSTRIYSALAIFFITIIIAFGLLYVGVHSGMISIGRNPLSKHSIMQNLTQVIIASALVLVGGLFGIYLLLRI